MTTHIGAGGTINIGTGSVINVDPFGQNPVSSPLPPELQAGEKSSNLKIGYGYVSTDAITAGGFDNLSLYAANSVVFKGNVTLNTAESIKISATSIADTNRNGIVTIAAPYILLAQSDTVGSYGIVNNSQYEVHFSNSPGVVSGKAVLNVEGDLIDLGYTKFGDQETIPVVPGSPALSPINYPAFAQVNFISQGDIRSLAGANVFSPGNLTFTAAQLYPVSGASAPVRAGYNANNPTADLAPFGA